MEIIRLARVGSRHRLSQDQSLLLQQNDTLFVAVADGNGGTHYVRSGMGARMACGAAVKALRLGVSTQDFPATVKNLFDSYVARHLARHPLNERELAQMEGDPAVYAYGTTLLAAEVTPTGTRLFQLGDGEIRMIDGDGSLHGLEADSHCHGNITTSMVQRTDTVVGRFRCGEFPPCAAVMLFTDGFDSVMDATQTLMNPDTLEESLTQALVEHAHGDDQTLVMALTDQIRDDGFRRGVEASLENLRVLDARKRHLAALQEEYDELTEFLNKMLLHPQLQRMQTDSNSMLRKAVVRYRELDALLNQKGEPVCL